VSHFGWFMFEVLFWLSSSSCFGWLSVVAGEGALGDASHSPAVCLSEALG